MPAIRPPSRVSRKKAIRTPSWKNSVRTELVEVPASRCAPASTGSARTEVCVPCSMGNPQVSGDHVLVPAHFVRRAVADLLAVVEHDHAVTDVHHHAHVVLD